MSDDLLHLEIVTPDKIVFSENIRSFEAPGVDGEFQIFPGHTPFLTGLKTGHIIFGKGGKKTIIAISRGFCEVKESKAVIIAHTAESDKEIDKARAEAAKKRAEQRLASKDDASIDEERARLALFRAINRLKAFEL